MIAPIQSEALKGLMPLPDFAMLEVPKKLLRRVYKDESGDLQLDYSNYTCTCSEWQIGRSRFDKLDVRRFCKHLGRRLPPELVPKFKGLSGVIVGSFSVSGVPLWSRLECFEITGYFAILISKPNWDWIDVLVVPCGKRRAEPYNIFGFNLQANRWSYGNGPRNAPIIRSILETWR